MKHFIITFFNLKLWTTDKNRACVQTESWLRHRVELFEKYCLPSIAAQNNKDFKWLCFFDIDTPIWLKNRFTYYGKTASQFEPVFLTAPESQEIMESDPDVNCRTLRRHVLQRLSIDDKVVVTSNCDNDDALAFDFVSRVQHAAMKRSDPKFVISLDNGLQYFPHCGLVIRMRYPHNHFLSLVENIDGGVNTIKWYPHTKIRKLLPSVHLDNMDSWLEIVHKRNVANSLRITTQVKYSFVKGAFDLHSFGLQQVFLAKSVAKGKYRVFPRLWVKAAVARGKAKILKLMGRPKGESRF